MLRGGCRTAKVKVAEPGQTLADDQARLEAVRDAIGPDGRVRDRRQRALGRRHRGRRASRCSTGPPAAWSTSSSRSRASRTWPRVRRAVGVPIAADESIRRAADPYRVRDLEAADVAVLKVQPLGGVRACLRIAEDIGLPVVVSSALETVDRDRGRRRAGGRAAGAALRLRPRDRAAADVRRRGRAAAAGRRRAAGAAAGRRRVAGARRRPTGSRTGRPGWPRSGRCGRIVDRDRHRHSPAPSSPRWSRPGVTEVVVAPGSRNAPLSLRGVRRRRRRPAPAAHPHRRAHRRLPRPRADQERQPRGRGLHLRHRRSPTCTRRSSRPPTPGVPLVVVTADRPARLRGTNANQTTDQVGVFGPLIPTQDASVGHRPAGDRPGRTSTCRSTSRCCPRTPVGAGRHAGSGAAVRATPLPMVTLEPGPRTVVVAGDDAGPQARQLAEAGGWPLLAEPSSGSRTGANALRTYRLLLAGELGERIERVVVCGHPTLSRPVSRLLARDDVAGHRHPDAGGCGRERPFPVDERLAVVPHAGAARRPGLAGGVARGRRQRRPPARRAARRRAGAHAVRGGGCGRPRAARRAGCSSSARPARSATST